MYEATSFECSRIAQDLQVRKVQVESVVQLFNEGNTVPYIARYAKEKTSGLDEDAVRSIQSRLNFLKQLNERKHTILKSIETHGRLTEELRREILNAPTSRRLEDLYLPYKARKKSLANAARDKGLEPLALAIWHSDPAVGNLDELLPSLINPEKQLNTAEDAKTGVQHLIAEMINETAEVRAVVRRVLWKTGTVVSTKNEKVPEGQGNEYKPYFQFKEATQEIRPHRILALNRGEKDGVLKVRLEWPMDQVRTAAAKALAEVLLEMAGQPAPQPSAPTPSPAPPEPAPGPPETPESPPEAPPFPPSPPEAPPESPPPHEPPPPGIPPMPEPPTGTPPSPHAAPLVESLTSAPKPVLTGDPLAEGTEFRSPHAGFLGACLDDVLTRLLLPNLEREMRAELTDEAELHASKVFAHTIRSLLMQPPVPGKRVLAIDPGFRTGCKLAALDESGAVLEAAVIFPHGGPGGGGRKGKDKKPKEQAAPPSTTPDASSPAAPSPLPDASVPAAPTPDEPVAPTPEVAPAVEAIIAAPPVAEPAPAAEAPPVEAVPANNAAAQAPTDSAPPEPTVDKRAEAKTKIEELVKKHQLNVIALGNGAACRETEEVIAEVIAAALPDLPYVIVSEVGASAYSVSPAAKEEFANVDANARSAITIGRRLQDPLSELVKIDPQSLSMGLYAHDVGRKELKEILEGVVESCVNQVGVDVNTSGPSLLRHVSGLNSMVAREIVEHRKNHGPFTSRAQLASLPGLSPARYQQAAGFLKVSGAPNPLDRMWIHPDKYAVAEKAIAELGATSGALDDKAAHAEFRRKLNEVNIEELAKKLEVSVAALDDLFHALARPGKDPRSEVAPPIFKKGILKLEELTPGQELKGTVLNVVDFGAFVDVGLKDSGLVHISQMANKYIKSPYDVVAVNDIVKVWVLKIDKDTNHVSLTMIQPGSERKPGERGPQMPRREGEGRPQDDRGPRPPRGRAPGGPPREGQRMGGRPPQRDRRGPPPREAASPLPPPLPPPPRKPKREAPKPKLTQAAMEGRAPLRTLGELAAFFAAKEEKDKPAPPPVEEKKETPVETPAEPKPLEDNPSATEPPPQG